MPHATGLGRIKPYLSPQIVDTFPIDNIEKEYMKKEKMKLKVKREQGRKEEKEEKKEEEKEEEKEEGEEEFEIEQEGVVKCKEISCG